MHPKTNPYEGWKVSMNWPNKKVCAVYLSKPGGRHQYITRGRYAAACAIGRILDPEERVYRIDGPEYDLNNLMICRYHRWSGYRGQHYNDEMSVLTLSVLYDYLRAAYYPEPAKEVILVCKHELYPLDACILQQMWTVFADRVTNPIVAETPIDPPIEFVESTPALIEPPVSVPVNKENDQMIEQAEACELEEHPEPVVHEFRRQQELPPMNICELLKKLAPPQDTIVSHTYPSVKEIDVVAMKAIKRVTIVQRIAKMTNVFKIVWTMLQSLYWKVQQKRNKNKPRIRIPGSATVPVIQSSTPPHALFMPDGVPARYEPMPIIIERITIKIITITEDEDGYEINRRTEETTENAPNPPFSLFSEPRPIFDNLGYHMTEDCRLIPMRMCR
jgi:hypothetical protein